MLQSQLVKSKVSNNLNINCNNNILNYQGKLTNV